MSERQETVRDVCAEMNGNEFDNPNLNRDGIIGARILAKGWAKRIISAYNREMAEKDAEIARLNDELFVYAGGHVITGSERYLRGKNKQLESEIARLKAKCDEYERQPELMADTAKQALELIKSQDARIALLERALRPVMEFNLQNTQSDPTSAVREAQRIMKEGEAK